jgi:hypothetical protein
VFQKIQVFWEVMLKGLKLFDPEEKVISVHQNTGNHQTHNIVSHPRTPESIRLLMNLQ